MPKKAYPGRAGADAERRPKPAPQEYEQPDWIAGAPNYDKFKGWTPEEVLVWLNID